MKPPSITVIVTDHWTRDWFERLILPTSRYGGANIKFLDIAECKTASEQANVVLQSLQREPGAACFACTDSAMLAYAAAVEMLSINENAGIPVGANFECFWLTNNKLACRDLLPSCNDIRHAAVRTSDRFLPDLGVDGFFKPLSDCVEQRECSGIQLQEAVPRPLFRTRSICSNVHSLRTTQSPRWLRAAVISVHIQTPT